MKHIKLYEQFVNELWTSGKDYPGNKVGAIPKPRDGMYGKGSYFRKYSTQESDLTADEMAALKKYSKYKTITFNTWTDTFGEIPSQFSKKSGDHDSYGNHGRDEFAILDVAILHDVIEGPGNRPNPHSPHPKKWPAGEFAVRFVLADERVINHVSKITAPISWLSSGDVTFK